MVVTQRKKSIMNILNLLTLTIAKILLNIQHQNEIVVVQPESIILDMYILTQHNIKILIIHHVIQLIMLILPEEYHYNIKHNQDINIHHIVLIIKDKIITMIHKQNEVKEV